MVNWGIQSVLLFESYLIGFFGKQRPDSSILIFFFSTTILSKKSVLGVAACVMGMHLYVRPRLMIPIFYNANVSTTLEASIAKNVRMDMFKKGRE